MESRVFAGKYVVERELSETPIGRTFLADGPDGERVVVKVVHPIDGAAATAVERDVSLISGIRHPALPIVHEWGHDGPDFFEVREYVPGADLELELAQQGRFAPLPAARYVAAAAEALAQIHARGLVHGNVKTANLIRTPEDEIKLVGNSLGLAEPSLSPGALPSAAYYMAPEQVEGGVAMSAATDVYAMGIVLYELVTGHVPFEAQTASEVADLQAHDVPASLKDSVPETPAALEAVVMRALEKSPEARYADGAALAAALRAVYEPPKLVEVPPPAAPEEEARKRSVWPWIVALVLVLAAIGGAWALGLFGTAKVAVPDLTGMTAAEASSTIGAAKLQVGSVTYSGGPVAGVADGSVASQSPVKGTMIAPSSKVDLTLAGVESVFVPAIEGESQTQALIDLKSAGLVAGTITTVTTGGVSPNMVIAQSPVSGATVDKGSAVDLQVSQNQASVPDVVGVTRADAEASLENVGFVVSVTQRSSTSVASGRVIEQNPTAGVTAQAGSTVAIVVSSGTGLVTVPDVGTMTQAAAVNALTAAGFKTQVTLHTGGGTVGTVISQSPIAGSRATSGSTVTITVAQ